MHVSPRSGKTVLSEQDVVVIERFCQLTRAMAYQFGDGSGNPDLELSKAATEAGKTAQTLAVLAKARYTADAPKPKKKKDDVAPAGNKPAPDSKGEPSKTKA